MNDLNQDPVDPVEALIERAIAAEVPNPEDRAALIARLTWHAAALDAPALAELVNLAALLERAAQRPPLTEAERLEFERVFGA